ncbi:MAG: mechanosensitive ion channel [Cyclobacteriaceae bacterium]|nr:mechanosensitive ion channel [Cyclobacteriaceae bacterium]
MSTFKEFLEFQLLSVGEYSIKTYDILVALLIVGVTRVILWGIKKALFRQQKSKKLDEGNTYAIYQIIKYVVWIIAIVLMLDTIGIKITVILAGSAALLVGIGLGLQQTFNDVISGIILLSERSIKVGDLLEVDGDIVKIQNIGLRTSTGLNRDEISIIIPNSLITTSKVINWSHQSKKARFRIDVGVAYGSDVDKVIKILEESANEHPEVTDTSLIEARLMDFGNSSLDFSVLFYSKNIFRIHKVKSDIRRTINKKFNENGITIPFPQMDVHMKPESAAQEGVKKSRRKN